MYLIKKITQTNLFEVYVDRNLKYSTIQKEEPPTYKILYNILRNIDNKYVYSSNNYLIPINITNAIVNNSELNTKISANFLHN